MRVILLPQTGAWIVERVESKNYIFRSGQGTYYVYAGPGNDGGPTFDRLSSRAGNDRLQGFGGHDELYGWEDNDVLEGGLTMTDGPTPATNLVSKALIAFAMQMYYEDTAHATDANKELFTQVTGGVQFDRADVAATLNDAKGYNDFHFYLVNTFSAADRQRIEDLLPVLRDWYVQADEAANDANAWNSFERSAA